MRAFNKVKLLMSLACILSLSLSAFYSEAKIKSNSKNSELVILAPNQKVKLKSGLEIEYVGQDFKSQSFSTNEISAQAVSLNKYILNLSLGQIQRQIFLSFSHGGMVSHESEVFEGFNISYVDLVKKDEKYLLRLKIEKLD